MAPFINISSNLFEQKVPLRKPIKWPHSDTTFGIDCVTEIVRFFYMDTFSQHVFQPIETRATCTIAPFINMHSALFALQPSSSEQPHRQHPEGTVCPREINQSVRIFQPF